MFKGHPKGLVAAALSNMGERFGYYIMNAVLLLFLVSKFGLSDSTAGVIYSVFYCAIYVLSLVGGIIADRSQNYKATIQSGLIVMALGYILLAIPITATAGNQVWLLPFTCLALAFIAFGNGLFKGNLQAIVGQMYDNLEEEAAKQGEEALKIARSKRDSGFQIFYVFINVGGLIAPFVAPLLREWWLKVNGFVYNAKLPELCHKVIDGTIGERMADYESLSQAATINNGIFTPEAYLEVFNQGVHYSFVASVAAMVISLIIFLTCKKMFPNPAKKENKVVQNYSVEEKQMMATEIKQRMYALFAVLGIAVFFWFAFHQNGQSLSLFARDFVKTDAIAPEIWQAVNPFFVIVLTPIIMWIFGALAKRGKEISTPRKIAIGMFIAGLAYLFLMILSLVKGYPSGEEFRSMEESVASNMKSDLWVMFVLYFFLTVAELFISPLGLSFVSKVAPKNLLGLCQGLWLGATALGNLLIWIGPVMYNAWPIWACWAVFLGVCLLSMCIMLVMLRWLEEVTK
ncbi:MAG: peptide MFS transporter [Bacteroidales bacterium]|nr:peptide MFS transporter [Bacteroidales bacterium]MDD5974837.1 peptide MFS transporter [Bacteroidales bacterium]MDY5192980.1 peptide MFS transporter [Candidatus Aphodosoma sp.]